MAGTIEVRLGEQWTAASWLFDWVLLHVASEVSDLEFAGHLHGIVDENLGFLSLPEVNEPRRSQFRDAVAAVHIVAANTWRDFDGREGAMDHINALQACTA